MPGPVPARESARVDWLPEPNSCGGLLSRDGMFVAQEWRGLHYGIDRAAEPHGVSGTYATRAAAQLWCEGQASLPLAATPCGAVVRGPLPAGGDATLETIDGQDESLINF